MVAIVISDSDSEFEQDVQEATRQLLMTVAPPPVRKIISDSDNDEENVPSWLSGVSLGTTLISLKQYHGFDSGRRYASFISRQLPVACSTSGTVLQAMGSWVRALNKAIDVQFCAPRGSMALFFV